MPSLALTDAGPAWLFCPADRPDRYAKAAAAADVVILDLEDAVAADAKGAARQALIGTALDPDRTVVRINPAGTPAHAEDLETLEHTAYHTVMLAKAESAQQITDLVGYRVLALCETPAGVLAASRMAARPNTLGLMWGAEDLVAALGGRSSRGRDGRYREVSRHARATVLLAAGAYHRIALDAVHLDIADLDGLREEAEDAAASGFSGTVCIHPSQVPVVRAAYAPSETEITWARGVLAAAATAGGVFAFEGGMVDEPVLLQARQVLRRA